MTQAAPLVVQVMNQFKAGLLASERNHTQAMVSHWQHVESVLQDKVELFTRRVVEDGLSPSQIRSRQFQLDRYISLADQVNGQLENYSNYADGVISERQLQLGRQGIRDAQKLIDAAAGVTVRYDKLPVSATENMVGLTGNRSPLLNLLLDTIPVGVASMLDKLATGVAIGENPRVIARDMVRNGLSQSLNRMLTIARTETLRVYRESSREQYKGSGVVPGYKRLATHDRRVCPACLMADGEFYKLDQVMAEHPQGRCAMVPIVDGYKPAEWQAGPDWFQEQTPDVQQEILGNGRYQAWRAGKFDLDQLVTVRTDRTWGDSLQPRSLADLLAGNATPYVVRPVPLAPETPAAPAVPTFKTTKEAEAWAKQNFNFKVNYGKLAPEVANQLNQSFVDNLQRVPQLQGAMSYMGSAQSRNKDVMEHFRASVEASIRKAYGGLTGVYQKTEDQIQKIVDSQLRRYVKKIPGNVYAYSYSGGGIWDDFKGIVVNEKFGGSPAEFKKSLEQSVRLNWHPEGTASIKAVIDHELGHEIDKVFGLKKDAGFLHIYDQIKQMPGGIGSNLSDYAKTKIDETIAEAWSEYLNNPTPRPAAKMIGDYIMQKATKGQKQ